MSSSYSWMISKDLIDEGEEEGTVGPRHTELSAKEIKEKGHKFRMLDADDEVYYEGYYVGDFSEKAFGPLDDFGAPNAGCADIQYLKKGKWETL